MMDTQEQIIASALKLPFEQRAAIINALIGSFSEDEKSLDLLLNKRISRAQLGELSNKSIDDIKHAARLDIDGN